MSGERPENYDEAVMLAKTWPAFQIEKSTDPKLDLDAAILMSLPDDLMFGLMDPGFLTSEDGIERMVKAMVGLIDSAKPDFVIACLPMMHAVADLKPGVSLEQQRAELPENFSEIDSADERFALIAVTPSAIDFHFAVVERHDDKPPTLGDWQADADVGAIGGLTTVLQDAVKRGNRKRAEQEDE